jgi:hypothetical protein
VTAVDDEQSMRARNDDRLLAGEDVDGESALVGLLTVLRDSATTPPAPTGALVDLLRTGSTLTAGLPTVSAAGASAASRRTMAARLAAAGLLVKVALGTGVAVAAVGTAAATDVLPDSVQQAVDGAAATVADVLSGRGREAPVDDVRPDDAGRAPQERPDAPALPAQPAPPLGPPAAGPPQTASPAQPPAPGAAVPPRAPVDPVRPGGGQQRPPAPAQPPAPPAQPPAPPAQPAQPAQPADPPAGPRSDAPAGPPVDGDRSGPPGTGASGSSASGPAGPSGKAESGDSTASAPTSSARS